MKKKPRFFCDNCGIEVDQNVKACPQCARFFSSIRCPSCGFTGEDKAFSGGCPSCSYSAPPVAVPNPPEEKIPAGRLPLWVYLLTVLAFFGVIAILILTLLQ
jgi:predicted RNA-binding Zn-ribbon protein involved in translation (DUF1610 family)